MVEKPWTWDKDTLVNPAGERVACVRAGVIHVGAHHIFTEIQRSGMRLVIVATTSAQEVYSVKQDGFSLNRLVANCAGRTYQLNRTQFFGRERQLLDSSGRVLARAKPRGQGLEISKLGDCADIPDVDFVFLTWVCLQADNSTKLYT